MFAVGTPIAGRPYREQRAGLVAVIDSHVRAFCRITQLHVASTR
jgi:hypothetical protein